MSDANCAEHAGQSLTHAGKRGPGRILVIEGDAEVGRSLVEQLIADGHLAELALSAGHAAAVAGMRPPRLVVLGELDPPRGALDLLEKIRGHDTDASCPPPGGWTFR
jgi:DNA-binding response OmpR family regulator